MPRVVPPGKRNQRLKVATAGLSLWVRAGRGPGLGRRLAARSRRQRSRCVRCREQPRRAPGSRPRRATRVHRRAGRSARGKDARASARCCPGSRPVGARPSAPILAASASLWLPQGRRAPRARISAHGAPGTPGQVSATARDAGKAPATGCWCQGCRSMHSPRPRSHNSRQQ